MMTGLLSIIIPVYNVKRYLDKCLDSVVGQTYKNIEIILVDDGSTDGSSEKCDEWGRKYKMIKVFHKKNGGLSSARNFGISKANGKYIGFVDPDDWVDKNMYYFLVRGCEKYDANIAWCNKVRVYNKSRRYENHISKKEYVSAKRALFLMLVLSDPSACNKIFKRQLFNGVKFPDKKLYEDIGTVPYLIEKSDGVYLDDIYGYFYNQQNGDSIVHEEFSISKMDYYYNVKKLNDFIEKKYPGLRMASESFFALSITAMLTDIYRYRKKYKNEYELLLRELGKVNYKKNKYIPWTKKVMVFLDVHHMIWVVNIIKRLMGHQ